MVELTFPKNSKAHESAGYSGTPLAAKLGFKDGMRAAFVALPSSLDALAHSVDFARVERLDGWRGVSSNMPPFDVIHAFTKSRAEIEHHLPALQSAIRRDGMIWVSWPKKASRVPTDVTEDVVRSAALKLDLVDVKVAAIDVVWSGLKLVIRKERR
jgi:hypothetical protein